MLLPELRARLELDALLVEDAVPALLDLAPSLEEFFTPFLEEIPELLADLLVALATVFVDGLAVVFATGALLGLALV